MDEPAGCDRDRFGGREQGTARAVRAVQPLCYADETPEGSRKDVLALASPRIADGHYKTHG